jgi:hypothetical protein
MVARALYVEGLYFAYVKTLLYDLLRIAPKIELFYKLRGRTRPSPTCLPANRLLGQNRGLQESKA